MFGAEEDDDDHHGMSNVGGSFVAVASVAATIGATPLPMQ